MKYRFLFFDLDGTLLNTLDDLHNAVNTILTRHHMPEITPEQTAAFLGNGAGHLIHCAVPAGTPEEQEKERQREITGIRPDARIPGRIPQIRK